MFQILVKAMFFFFFKKTQVHAIIRCVILGVARDRSCTIYHGESHHLWRFTVADCNWGDVLCITHPWTRQVRNWQGFWVQTIQRLGRLFGLSSIIRTRLLQQQACQLVFVVTWFMGWFMGSAWVCLQSCNSVVDNLDRDGNIENPEITTPSANSGGLPPTVINMTIAHWNKLEELMCPHIKFVI